MSRLSDLLYQLKAKEPQLAGDLEREFAALADRRAFGLNFERHIPETVELPGRKVRKGDKVRILTPRGDKLAKVDESLWTALAINRTAGTALLARLDTGIADSDDRSEGIQAALDDLVVVAKFRDPIYPGLTSTGKVERGGDKPFHTVINAENYLALETLLFTHRGKVDAIYIDPPYNTGARDWKYNNDYIEGDDLYRHSKWLAFMERRLTLARKLLNPANSVLIVAIDEKEYLRLGLLLEQTFPEASLQMISTLVNPAAVPRPGAFGRSDEYVFFVCLGFAAPQRTRLGPDWVTARGRTHTGRIRWDLLRRSGTNAARSDRPRLFYPLYIDPSVPRIVTTGEPLPNGVHEAPERDGLVALLPIRQDGSEGNWTAQSTTLMARMAQGRVRVTGSVERGFTISVLKDGEYAKVEQGEYEVEGRAPDGSLIVAERDATEGALAIPQTQWRVGSHDSSQYGSRLLSKILPDRRFPFPKSLYAVEDALRFFVNDKHDAIVLDFFAGSGTTAHAVMRLNRQDGGRRQCILVTNNEVAGDEQKALSERGLRPGDSEWEEWGICEYITKPRIRAVIQGTTPENEPIKGDYKFTDEFSMSEGLAENVEFFTLTYEAPLRVASNREFARIAPLLWMRAGSLGPRIDDISAGWDVVDAYGVLADLDQTEDFLKAVAVNEDIRVCYIVTDEDWLFESVAQELPERVEPVRLYEAYLRNFEIDSRRGLQ